MTPTTTSLRCPACRAENSTGPQCRRCKADLSLLWQLEQHRAARWTAAITAFQSGDWLAAQALATQVNEMRRGADAERLQALAHLMQWDFAAAWASVRRQGNEVS